jgi:alpha-galactosidase
LDNARNWSSEHLGGDPAALPFSFTFGGRPSAELLNRWPLEQSTSKLDEQRVRRTLKYTDPQSKVEVRCEAIEYLDYPTVEWTLYFRNTGTADSPILEDIQALNATWERDPESEFLLHHAVGSPANGSDYGPLETPLGPEAVKRISAAGGRPTNSDLSYFNLQWGSQGLIVVVGWPGQWAAEFARDAKNGIRIRAGQELTHFKLLPGEEVRTPQVRSVAGIVWEPGRLSFHPGPNGEYSVVRFTAPESGEFAVQAKFLAIDKSTTTDAHILHRGKSMFDGRIRAADESKTTAFDGKLTAAKGETLDFVVGWGNGTHVCDSTGLEIRLIDPSGKTHDAAKEFHPEQNPNGPWRYGYLAPGPAPVSSTFKAYDRHHKLESPQGVRLLNLGNPAAREWLTEHIDRLLTEQGIDLYRQDFNMDPLAFWRAADAPDRQGITEIKHVTGFLAYWDELRRRHPDMLIDSCASGGRRNDLETMRRAAPLWRSDYAFEPVGHQCMTYGISFWLPFHGTGTVASAAAPYYGGGFTKVEPYAFWSNVAPSLVSGIDIRVKEIDYETLRRLYNQWRQTSACYYGDYYPLTPYSRDNKAWMAWQFDLPEQGKGVVKAFRRADSTETAAVLRLRGLNSQTRYALRRLRADGDKEMVEFAGSHLLEKGLPVTIEEQPGAAVITYEQILEQEND